MSSWTITIGLVPVTVELAGESSAERGFAMAELVERTATPAPTVRFYLAQGLLPPPRRVARNRFLYDERHVELVRLVRLLRERRHLSIDAIKRMLPELLPDLVGRPEGGAFRPEMWHILLATHTKPAAGPSTADRVLDSGVALFAEYGYGEVSVDDVCRSAGVAKGSFYRNYASKDELFFAVVAEATAATIEQAFVLSDDKDGLARSVAPYVVVFIDLVSLAAKDRPGCREALDRTLERLGVIESDRPNDRAGVLFQIVRAVLERTDDVLRDRAGDRSGDTESGPPNVVVLGSLTGLDRSARINVKEQ